MGHSGTAAAIHGPCMRSQWAIVEYSAAVMNQWKLLQLGCCRLSRLTRGTLKIMSRTYINGINEAAVFDFRQSISTTIQELGLGATSAPGSTSLYMYERDGFIAMNAEPLPIRINQLQHSLQMRK